MNYCKPMTIVHIVVLFIFIMPCCLYAIDCPIGDLDGDCIVGMSDLIQLADKWLYPGWSCIELGLVSSWKLDEFDNLQVSDQTGLHPGVIEGSPAWRPDSGQQGGALELDGVDDYVTVPGYTGILGSQPRTCTAWIKTTATRVPILFWGSAKIAGGTWDMLVNGFGELRVQVLGGPETNSVSVVNTGQWVHVAAVFPAGASNTRDIQLFVNGVREATRVKEAAVDTVARTDVRIGANATLYFKGLLDEVRIYDRALTAEEIWSVYLTGLATEPSVDINGDCAVNLSDLAPISTHWLKTVGPVVISEFLADNESKLPLEGGEILDGNGESSDWIELYNPTGTAVDLEGWSLTDDASDPSMWSFPKGATIGKGQYLIVFASKKEPSDYPTNYPYKDSKGYWHTNFKLDASGEYLALVDPTGRRVTEFKSHEFAPGQFGYLPQKKNISYGLYIMDAERYFSSLTPGYANAGEVLGIVTDTRFSVNRGFYSSPFNVTIASDTPGAAIRYTLDGKDPTLTTGNAFTEPITINRTTCLRAAAFKAGWKSSNVDSQTYIFPDSHPGYQTALKSLPVISLGGDAARTFFYDTTPGATVTSANSGVMAIYGGSYSGEVWVSSGGAVLIIRCSGESPLSGRSRPS